MKKLVISLLLCVFSFGLICCEWQDERGIIMSVYWNSLKDKIKHFAKFPGYEYINMSSVDDLAEGFVFDESAISLSSLDVDYTARTVYAYDKYYSSIFALTGYNKALNVTGVELKGLHMGISQGSVQVAVDWLSHTIYWCDPVFRWIVAAAGTADKIDEDYYKVIVDDHLASPSGLAVDPINLYLFWADSGRNGKNGKIERSGLLGEDRITFDIPNMQPPSHIDLDVTSERVYWIQEKSEALLSANYDGKDIRHITRFPDSTLYDLAIFRDVVYISDTRNDNMYTVNTTSGQREEEPIKLDGYKIYGLAVYSEENQPKKDRDYCAEKNCDQLCISAKNNAICTCSEGFTYNGTSGKCEEINAGLHRAFVFASQTHICLVDIRSFAKFLFHPVCKFTLEPAQNTTSNTRKKRQDPTVPAGDRIKLFDLNMKQQIVYYANEDNKIYERSLILPIENKAKELVAQASGNISGMAFDDEDNGNVFWSEIDTGKIYMVNVKDKSVITVNNSETLEKPKNLLVLLQQRKLAWVAGEIREMAIQTMNMDGTGLQDVVYGFYEIGALTFDQEQQLFYFLEPSKEIVYSTPVDGSDTPKTLYSPVPERAYLLIHYNNYLAWVYQFGELAHAIGMYNYVNETFVGDGYFDEEKSITDMKILDAKLQTPERASPCAFQNGGCEHACITKFENNQLTKVCECPIGYQLEDDQKGCKTEVVADNFIIASDWTSEEVLQIDLQTHAINAVPIIQDDKRLMNAFFDAESKRIVWSEYNDDKVYSANLNGTDKKIIADLEYSYADRFTKDTVSGNIYYSGYEPTHIGIITPSGEHILLNSDFRLEDIHAVAIHPEKGWLYFTAVDVPAYIGRSNMDGTDVKQIITGEHVQLPYGLTIDYIKGYLYWSDSYVAIIQRCDLDGEKCETIVNKTGGGDGITDIVTDGEYLYYAAFKKSHIVKVSLTAPFTETEVGYSVGLGKINSISLYRSDNINTQSVARGCASNGGLGDCSTFCLPTSFGRTCACGSGVDLKPDKRTCSDIYQCKDIIKQAYSTNEEVEVKFASTCLRRQNDTCEYVCPKNYVRMNESNPTLTCTGTGWDRENDQLCEEIRCPNAIANGALDVNCKRKIGGVCSFTCDSGFTKTEENTFCTAKAQWHKEANAYCRQTMGTPAEDDTILKRDAITAIIVLGIFIVLLVILAAVLICRIMRKRSSLPKNEETESYQKGPKKSEDSRAVSRTSSDNASYIQPKSNDAPVTGHTNPTYSRPEPLPAVTVIDVAKDKSVISYDDRLQERL